MHYVRRGRGGAWMSSRRRRIALGCVAMFAVIPATQATASSSPLVTTPSVCSNPAALSAQAQARDAPRLAQTDEWYNFCEQLAYHGRRANAFAAKVFTAAERRRIRRVLDGVARRYVPASEPARASTSAITLVALARFGPFDLGVIKDFAKKSLKTLKRVGGFVGRVVKVLPQARLLKCGVFAALGGAVAYAARETVRTVLVAAAGACIGSLLEDVWDAYGKLPKR
jgi:hypothetical protein